MRLLITMLYVIFYMRLLAISKAYVNVALNKPAYQQYQSGDDTYDAGNAVDGRKSDLSMNSGQCAVSWYEQTATWWVNLSSIHSIQHITIYFRTDNHDSMFRAYIAEDLLGFSVYVSNTKDRLQGTLCFKDNNFTINTIPPVFTTNCSVHGQYVIYYNERLPGVVYPDGYYRDVRSELCEVEVYGCPVTGCYGSNNTFPCPDVNCQYCHIETGTCQGCKPGYQGHHCELECDRGSYGIGCNERCGHCRDVSQCSHINGTCLTGCEADFKKDLCKLECNRESYGYDCNETCGHCRNTSFCFPINGTCFTGCNVGYEGALCKTLCSEGFYGVACNETFGNCRDVKTCNHENGTCLTGCDAGYWGSLCNTPCSHGFFGYNCSERCLDTCAGCNNVTGLCDSGCKPGWKGYFCNKGIRYFTKRLHTWSSLMQTNLQIEAKED